MGNLITGSKEEYEKEYIHSCKLPHEVEILEYFVPQDKKFRQWFRRQCLISSKVSHRRLCVKSNRALEQDRAIHLSQYYYIIHPFSPFRFYWEIFTMILIIIQFLIIPNVVILDRTHFPRGMWLACFLQTITLSNLGVQFMSGYFEQSTRTIILHQRSIIKHYLKTYFIPDLIGNLPIELILFYSGSEIIVPRSILIKVFLNIFTLIDYSEKYREKRQYPLCSYRLVQYTTVFVLGLIWITGLIGVAAYADQKLNFSKVKWWLFTNNAFILVFGIGKTEWIVHGYELYVHFIAITFGFIMRNIVIAQIILIFKSYYSSKRKYSQLVCELKEYIHFKRLPKSIKDKILNYYNFIYQQFYYNESEIWNLMSDKLKYEFERNLYKVWFEADIFRFCPTQIVQSLVLLLKKEIILENDIIYQAGSVADHIYYLKYGTVTLHNDTENILVHENNFFADSALILENTMYHTETAIAEEDCEVYKLHRENFREVIQHFPEEYTIILSILNKRKQYITQHPESMFELESYFPHANFAKRDESTMFSENLSNASEEEESSSDKRHNN